MLLRACGLAAAVAAAARCGGDGNRNPAQPTAGTAGTSAAGAYLDAMFSFYLTADGSLISNSQSRCGWRWSPVAVAVLTDGVVVRSGEATTIAFKKRPKTRSFGLVTCGRSTTNSTYRLSDGATLFLTTAVIADRERTRYGNPVPPDETHADLTQALSSAVAWLQAR